MCGFLTFIQIAHGHGVTNKNTVIKFKSDVFKFKSNVRYSKFCTYNKYIEWNSSEIKVSVFIKNCFLLIKFIYSEKATNFCQISTVDLSYVVTVKSTVEISQNFVAFSEYMNFTKTWFWSYTTSTTNNFRQPEEYSDFPEDGYEQHHQPKFQSLDLEHNLRHTR